jgi:hypothetical protein
MPYGPINTSQPVNWASPLNRGLVSWWLCLPSPGWRGGATFRDLCNRNHGTLTNMDPPTDWVAKGLEFDGTNDYVYLRPSFTTYPFTMVVSGFPASGGRFIFSQAETAAVSFGAFVTLTGYSDGSAQFSIRAVDSGTVGTAAASAGTFNPSQITHLVGVATSDSSRSLYVNGNLIQTDTTGIGGSTAWDVMEIGRLGRATPDYHAGTVASAALYRRQLSAAEVAALYLDSLQNYPQTINRLSPRRYVMQGGGGPTFKSAWAQGSNVLIGA